jgi:hypothetical protein
MTTVAFRRLLAYLRKAFPVGCGVNVRRCVRKESASTTFDGRQYRIRINRLQDHRGQVDSLLHEWAHVRAIEQAYQHDGTWGQIFAKIYESWAQDFYEEPE